MAEAAAVAAVAEAAAARRPAEQEAGKRQALTIDLTLDDDPPVKVEEGLTAAAPSRRRQGRGGRPERPAARVAKPAAAAGRGARA